MTPPTRSFTVDVTWDAPAIFGAPVGRAGALVRARLRGLDGAPEQVELVLAVPVGHLATLEAVQAFGNRRETRSANLRGAFDPALPIEVTLHLDEAALVEHICGPEDARRAALVGLVEALGRGDATPLTAPTAWRFESAVQPVAGRSFSAGYRNEAR